MRKITALIIFVTLIPSVALAHQPRIVESDTVNVPDPEISKAYYGTLEGSPHIYTISSNDSFNLYVGVLVPKLENQETNISARITKEEDSEFIKDLSADSVEWEEFFEEFGQSTYLEGPEFDEEVGPGTYYVEVYNPENTGKYSLAIGKIEFFDGEEGANALRLIPELKRNFFEESPATFIFSPFGYGYIIVLYIIAIIFGLVLRIVVRKVSKNEFRQRKNNIGNIRRVMLALFGIAVLLIAIFTTWNGVLIFFSGFLFFESLFAWSLMDALIGKNKDDII